MSTDTTEAPAADADDTTEQKPSRALTVAPSSPLEILPTQQHWTDEQRMALVELANLPDNTPEGILSTFFHLCARTRLDPFAREIYLIRRKSYNGDTYTIQTGIDGFRHLAEDTHEYVGQTEPEWCGPDGVWRNVWLGGASNPPVAARVGILRRGHDAPAYGVALYDEFVPMEKVYGADRKPVYENGKVKMQPGSMWLKMPANQLAKVAEAQAFRKAFPRQTGGMYVAEEMSQADAESRRLAEETRDVEAAQKRRAYIEAKRVVEPSAPPEPVIVAEDPEERARLIAEITEQANVVGKSVDDYTMRTRSVGRPEGQPADLADLSLGHLAGFVNAARPYVDAEREKQRKAAERPAPETHPVVVEQVDALPLDDDADLQPPPAVKPLVAMTDEERDAAVKARAAADRKAKNKR